jgi:ABC-2 type transport system ATP-binding protein
LDPEASLAVRELILHLKTEGRTIVVCTHNLDEAERLADIVGILRRRLLVCDTLDRLRAGGDGAPVTVRMRGAADSHLAVARAVPGIAAVSADGPLLRLTVSEPYVVTPRVIAALVGNGAEIVEVRSEAPSLETIYLRSVREA